MRFLVTGLNHTTAPVELRERLAIAKEALPETTRALLSEPGVKEAMILSTCNRVELVVSHNGLEPHLPEFLAEHFRLDRAMLAPHLYQYQDEEAVRHMFRVAASLDSMVVGEPQILGQVKEAWTVARELGAVKGPLDKLLQEPFPPQSGCGPRRRSGRHPFQLRRWRWTWPGGFSDRSKARRF